MIKKLVSCVVLCSLILSLLCSCNSDQGEQGAKLERFTETFIEYFDTGCTVVGYEENQEEFDSVCANIEKQLSEYNQLYDIYKSYEGINNIRTINKNAGVEPVVVDKKIIDLIDFSAELYDKTGGTVNIAMGSVLSIWHDYREKYVDSDEKPEIPPMDKLLDAAKHTSFDDIVIDKEKSTVFLKDPDMMLDVGAVAKGYATEQIAKSLIADGISHYALNFGGNIRTIGPKNDGTDWSAAVTNPDKESEKSYLMKVKLRDQTFVTSGSYERFYTVDGVRYHHIIDPKTLMPNNTFTSVSILANNSGLADVLSTALFNLTYEEGIKVIEKFEGVEAVWVTADNKILYSKNFESIILEKY